MSFSSSCCCCCSPAGQRAESLGGEEQPRKGPERDPHISHEFPPPQGPGLLFEWVKVVGMGQVLPGGQIIVEGG